MSDVSKAGDKHAPAFHLRPIGDPAVYQAAGFQAPDLSDPTTFTTGQDLSIEFQRKLWVIQRVGWIVMALIIVLALLGVFGGQGWLSSATAGEPGNLDVEYARFEHRYRPSTLTVIVPAGTAQDGQLTIWLDAAYVSGLELSAMVPEPSEQVATGDGLGLIFAVADPSQPFEVSISLEYERIGRERGKLWLDGQPPITFDQLIYP